jgi:signal transduction histidine kinase
MNDAEVNAAWAGWLATLGPLLMDLDVVELALVERVELSMPVETRPQWPREARVLVGEAPARDPAAGLLIAVDVAQTPVLWLGLEQPAPSTVPWIALAALLRRSAPASDATGVRDAIHALRNALNGISMSTAALGFAARSAEQQDLLDDLRRSVDDGLRALSRLTVELPAQD